MEKSFLNMKKGILFWKKEAPDNLRDTHFIVCLDFKSKFMFLKWFMKSFRKKEVTLLLFFTFIHIFSKTKTPIFDHDSCVIGFLPSPLETFI